MDRYPNPPGCGKAVLYADAVVGWSWIFFKDYDFENNPLGFSERILPILKRNGEAMKEIVYADAIGMDFHKVGWTPWISSCFLYKNAEEFESLHMRGKDSYLQVRTPYNPMYYTLEVSRTVAGSMAAWATLKYFGKEGFQSLLGGILETKYYLYDLLKTHPDMICVNPDDTGFITLFRVYEKGVDAVTEYDAELTNKSARAALLKHNVMTKAIGDKLFEWFRAGKKINGKYTPYLSYSTGFRNTEYNIDGKDPDEVIFALKAFPMNVFVTPEIMKWTLHCVAAARDEVLKG
jgi:L-2,4-diaminobutyrate decarboxylase